ncbi:hypothetical protein WR25_10555 [Diploscapter pachys]|uniref:Uncharacterized protein n=1 Tax=Diploscapter pachys TaxID=2018661 RepID=A0A2A2JTE5_9BILA|nr:hypothetical protein WR25_10555 [Diploscapter pachys]
MVGYLYAISRGAEWIYDTDDDNRPAFGGLESFDYSEETSGVRFERDKSDDLRYRLFNPYLHFGRKDMWPRGFPLEFYKLHNHTDANFRLCEKMKRPAVQQGLVDMDPDVDAIFRLLNADPRIPPSEHFNSHAPPVILGRKMYSPWNSQNTLFHRNAFFTMFLPTSVSFRTTDIWRSFFAQKLLHLIDEYVAFYPVNAVQIRNAHNYLEDFESEQDVYLKSGKILTFLDFWNCNKKSTYNCTIELAEQFGNWKFWDESDVELVKDWVYDLIRIGYDFPKLKTSTYYELPDSEDVKNPNCRRMFLQLLNDKPIDSTKPAKLYQQITSHLTLAKLHTKIKQLPKLLDTALIVVHNFPMKYEFGLSLIQRLYTPYFGVVIFCGSWYPENQTYTFFDTPPLQHPFNYIHIHPQEMNSGYNHEICMIKTHDLRLRNIRGYFAMADDAVLNFWQNINLDMVFHQWGTRNAKTGNSVWWETVEGKFVA